MAAFLFAFAAIDAAIVEVTEGGGVKEATYQFSDSSGTQLATLVGNSTAVTASTDLVTGGGNSLDALAATVAQQQATNQQQQATIQMLLEHLGLNQPPSAPPPPPVSGPVIFTHYDAASISVSPGVINKIGGGTNFHTGSAARADVGFSAGEGIAIAFTCSATDKSRMIGFVRPGYQTSGSYSSSHASMPYGLFCQGWPSQINAREDGSDKGDVGSYTSTSALEIRLHPNGVVEYVKDGTVFYTSATVNTQWPLYVGVSLNHEASPSISNIQYSALP